VIVKRRNHAKGIALLQQLVRIGLTDTETNNLMQDVLELPLSYFAAVQKVVKEGRWRTAKDPVAYVRTAASRTGIADCKWAKPKGLPVPGNMRHDEFIDFQRAPVGAKKMAFGMPFLMTRVT
jgi:hypothetical protein